MKDIVYQVNGINTFDSKRKFQKGTFVYFIFRNDNRYEQYAKANIQEIAVSLYSFKFELVTWYNECSFKRFLDLTFIFHTFFHIIASAAQFWEIWTTCYQQYFQTSIKNISQPKT